MPYKSADENMAFTCVRTLNSFILWTYVIIPTTRQVSQLTVFLHEEVHERCFQRNKLDPTLQKATDVSELGTEKHFRYFYNFRIKIYSFYLGLFFKFFSEFLLILLSFFLRIVKIHIICFFQYSLVINDFRFLNCFIIFHSASSNLYFITHIQIQISAHTQTHAHTHTEEGRRRKRKKCFVVWPIFTFHVQTKRKEENLLNICLAFSTIADAWNILTDLYILKMNIDTFTCAYAKCSSLWLFGDWKLPVSFLSKFQARSKKHNLITQPSHMQRPKHNLVKYFCHHLLIKASLHI